MFAQREDPPESSQPTCLAYNKASSIAQIRFRHLHFEMSPKQISKPQDQEAMDTAIEVLDTTNELLRLITLHKEKKRILQETQDQEYEHRKRMLELEHKYTNEAVIDREKALSELAYEQRKRMLELEHQPASPGLALAPARKVTGSEDAASKNKPQTSKAEASQATAESAGKKRER